MRRRLLLCSVALIAVTACSGSDAPDGAPTDDPATTVLDEAVGDTVAAEATDTGQPEVSATDAPTVTEAAPATEAAPTTTQPPAEPFFGDFDTVVVQATDESGGGIRPLLEWEAADGADHYGVYVYAPNGATYWAWRGAETSVFVGGATQIRDDAPGPSITDGMSWAVVAYDAELLPIAASPIRPIAP